MKKKSDQNILYLIVLFGFIMLPIVFRKKPIEKWLLIFFMKGVLTSFLDSITVAKGFTSYRVRVFPKIFKINIVFDYLIFPLACVIYNQFVEKMRLIPALLSVFIFSVPMTIGESILEKKTDLLQYKRKWSSFTSLYTLTITFWVVYGIVYFIYHPSKKVRSKISL